MNNLLLLDILW